MDEKRLKSYTYYRDKIMHVVNNDDFFEILDNFIIMSFMSRKVNYNKRGLSSVIRKTGDVIYFRLDFDDDKVNFKAKFDNGVIRGKYIRKENCSWYRIKDMNQKVIFNNQILFEENECIKLFDEHGYQSFEKNSNDKRLFIKDGNEKKLINNLDFNKCETIYSYRVGPSIVQTKEIKHNLSCDQVKDFRSSYLIANPNYKCKEFDFGALDDIKEITLEEKQEYLKKRVK